MAEEIQRQNSQNQPEPPTSNKRIAKNALMLYIRMFFALIVGLYTSRVVLATLGVEDYGIFGVVGSIMAMLDFLNASMSGATSRFLTFELGRGDKKKLAETFSSALIVHIGIALLVFILAETVGLWFLCNKLVIPESRMGAAHWVYQCSILSAMLAITQAPYNASIIAHEKMGVYAYVEILNVTLKLLIVYLLVIGNFDKLKLYAILVLVVSVLIMLIYRIYCIRKFKETHFHFIWKKDILKSLLSFSGWNLYGNLGGMVQQQGTNFVINFFFGVVMNAAVSIGLTVANSVNRFGANIMVAFRPQIIKNYSQGNKEEMKKLTILAIKIIMFIYCIVAVPVYVETENLLELWLVKVPEHAVVFCRLFLISIFFETIRYVLIIDIHASGNVKWVSFFSGTLFILVPFVTYIWFKLGFSVNSAITSIIVCNILLCLINTYLIKHYVQFPVSSFYTTILRVVLTSALALFLAEYIKSFVPAIKLNIITNSLIGVILVTFAYFSFCFDKDQRKYTIKLIKKKLHFK